MRALALLLVPFAGCTERFLHLKSEPPGATVLLDGKEVGKTPCEVKFTWYGDRELVLELPGHCTRTEILEVDAPWWQFPPFDLFTDVLLPIKFTDRHEFSFRLERHTTDPGAVDEVRKRAEELRAKARQ